MDERRGGEGRRKERAENYLIRREKLNQLIVAGSSMDFLGSRLTLTLSRTRPSVPKNIELGFLGDV